MAEFKVIAEISGLVRSLETALGAPVAAGDILMLLESMKMEIPLHAPRAGRLKRFLVEPQALVAEGQVVALIEG